MSRIADPDHDLTVAKMEMRLGKGNAGSRAGIFVGLRAA
jgi:hypothetical protein